MSLFVNSETLFSADHLDADQRLLFVTKARVSAAIFNATLTATGLPGLCHLIRKFPVTPGDVPAEIVESRGAPESLDTSLAGGPGLLPSATLFTAMWGFFGGHEWSNDEQAAHVSVFLLPDLIDKTRKTLGWLNKAEQAEFYQLTQPVWRWLADNEKTLAALASDKAPDFATLMGNLPREVLADITARDPGGKPAPTRG